jgi:Fe-S oxidoreductase
MRTLPVLGHRRAALETCVYCPKLCRGACPVSTAEPRETLTPWGKMTTAWMVAQGDLPLEQTSTTPAWACTGCLACSQACAHGNPVAESLLDARAAAVDSGVSPPGAVKVLAGFERHLARTRRAARRLASAAPTPSSARDAVLVGCGYLRGAHDEASAALEVAARLSGGTVALVESCCGLPLRLAGDRRAFERHAVTMAESLSRFERVFVVDPGCALTLKRLYPGDVGIDLSPRLALLIEAAAQEIAARAPSARRREGSPAEAVRWHDPCSLGRGLGVYDAPRSILSRVLGRPPDEFDQARAQAACSGAGGLLPATLPDVSERIAASRLAAHQRGGGGRIVTGCAASLLALRRRARPWAVQVDDVVTWAARALRGNDHAGAG